MDIMQFLKSIVNPSQAQVLMYLVAANLLLGIVAALAKGAFELAKLKDFWKRVLVVFGSYLVVSVAAKGLADFVPMVTVIWVALIAYMAAQIVSNLKDMGLPIPSSVTKYVEKVP